MSESITGAGSPAAGARCRAPPATRASVEPGRPWGRGVRRDTDGPDQGDAEEDAAGGPYAAGPSGNPADGPGGAGPDGA
jgi:hypothetical protein